MNPIPQAQPHIDASDTHAVKLAVESGWITEGRRCDEFSAQLNAFTGAEYGVFAPNGTLALVLAMLALDIGEGDEVIVPDATFVASATAVLMTGARPVFVDVDASTYHIDVDRCEEARTECTKAVMPVHLNGSACDMRELMDFAWDFGLMVVEDAAPAVGVRYDDTHVGTFGDAGTFSFYADKTITTGEGGYVMCRERSVYERLMTLRNQGRERRGSYTHPHVGYNFRITDIQGALGCAQMGKLEHIIKRKRTIQALYEAELASVGQIAFLPTLPESESVPFRVVLLCEAAPFLMLHLEDAGIQTRPFFTPLHRQPCFAEFGYDDADFPNAVDVWRRGVCLPVYPGLTDEQVRFVCQSVKEFYR